MSRFDLLYRRSLLTRIFPKGWGKPEVLRRLIDHRASVHDRRPTQNLVPTHYPISIDKRTTNKNVVHLEGSFLSPFDSLVANAMDDKNKIARFQMITPKEWPTKYRPICIHLAGTGDHNYMRRRVFLANRLLKDGIGSILLCNPYYGERKPDDQSRSSLNYVSDLFVMGGALILECQALLHWCENHGYGPLAVHGISMGGHMASLASTVWPKPIAVIPCLTWTTASVVFTQGAMSPSVCWKVLAEQFAGDTVFANEIWPRVQPAVPPNCVVPDTMVELDVRGAGGAVAPSPNGNGILPSSLLRIFNRQYSQESGGRKVWGIDLLETMRRLWTKKGPISEQSLDEMDALEKQLSKQLDKEKGKSKGFLTQGPLDREVVDFMRDLMDAFTHLGHYPCLSEPKLATIVCAEHDAYYPRQQSCLPLDQLWPGAELRMLKETGHIGAYLRNTVWKDDNFRLAIVDTLNREIELCRGEAGPLGEQLISPRAK